MNTFTPEEEREHLLKSAKREIANLKAMKLLILSTGEDYNHAKLESNGLYHAFSDPTVFIPIIDREIKEIRKAINGKPNKWE